MDKRKRKNGEKLLQTFQMKKSYSETGIFVSILGFLFYLITILVFVSKYDWLNTGISTIGIIMTLAMIFSIIRQKRNPPLLNIYEDGIEYEHHSKVIFSAWDNLNDLQIELITSRRGNSYLCLLVLFREAEVISEASSLDKWVLRQHSNFFIPLYDAVAIPIDMKDSNVAINRKALQETEFGQYLFKYAPHLFELEKEKAKNS